MLACARGRLCYHKPSFALWRWCTISTHWPWSLCNCRMLLWLHMAVRAPILLSSTRSRLPLSLSEHRCCANVVVRSAPRAQDFNTSLFCFEAGVQVLGGPRSALKRGLVSRQFCLSALGFDVRCLAYYVSRAVSSLSRPGGCQGGITSLPGENTSLDIVLGLNQSRLGGFAPYVVHFRLPAGN